jgi:hypothetical protein
MNLQDLIHIASVYSNRDITKVILERKEFEALRPIEQRFFSGLTELVKDLENKDYPKYQLTLKEITDDGSNQDNTPN